MVGAYSASGASANALKYLMPLEHSLLQISILIRIGAPLAEISQMSGPSARLEAA